MHESRQVRSLLALFALACLPAGAEDWSRFRGPNGSGASASKGVPVEFGLDKNKLWESEVPFGRSSPVVVGDRIFLTAVEGGKLVTLALDRKSGKTLWRSTIERARVDEFHHDTDSATPTPVSDGSSVYVFFQEAGLVAYDENGKQRWHLGLGPFRNFYGIAASPVLAGDTLFMVCDQALGSFVVAVDKSTGKERWRVNRPARLESYSTPILYPATGEPKVLIVAGSRWVDAYDLANGKSVWAVGNVGTAPVSSPVLAGDMLFVTAPNQAENGWGPFDGVAKEHDRDGNGALSRAEVEGAWLAEHFGWLDHDADGAISAADWKAIGDQMVNDHWGVYAIRLDPAGGKPQVTWNYRQNIPEISSPLVRGDVCYVVKDGILTSLDARTGELLKRGRIGTGSPKVYASPVAADDKIYVATLEGDVYVISAAGAWEVLASTDLGEEIWASPAIADGKLYVRTRAKLYSFGEAVE